jgi:hypothetical protein
MATNATSKARTFAKGTKRRSAPNRALTRTSSQVREREPGRHRRPVHDNRNRARLSPSWFKTRLMSPFSVSGCSLARRQAYSAVNEVGKGALLDAPCVPFLGCAGLTRPGAATGPARQRLFFSFGGCLPVTARPRRAGCHTPNARRRSDMRQDWRDAQRGTRLEGRRFFWYGLLPREFWSDGVKAAVPPASAAAVSPLVEASDGFTFGYR